MKLKKLLALLLCFAFLLLVVFACASPEVDDAEVDDEPDILEPVEEPPEVEIPADDDDPAEGIDFEAAFAAFPADTVMIRADDLTVTWAELFVFLFRSVQELMQYSIAGIDWNDDLGGVTLAEIVLSSSTERTLPFMIVEYGAGILDVSLSEEDLKEHNADLNDIIDSYGSKEEFMQVLWENGGFHSFEVFERLLLLEYTSGLIFLELYGESGEDFPDEDVIDYVEQNEFMMAKHILILSAENDSARDEAEDILKQLNNKIKANDFEDFFDSMMLEHSEDPGSLANPEGYLFQFDDMVAPFSEACAALEIGQLSDIVETEYGYHIILRVAVDFNSVPGSVTRAGLNYSVRELAAIEDFEKVMYDWRQQLDPEFTPEYDSIDLASIFYWRTY